MLWRPRFTQCCFSALCCRKKGKIKWCFFPCQGAILAAVASRKCPSKIIREHFMTLMVRSHHKLYDLEVEFKFVRTLYDAYLNLHFWIYRLRRFKTPDFVAAPFSKDQDSRLLVKFLWIPEPRIRIVQVILIMKLCPTKKKLVVSKDVRKKGRNLTWPG